VDAQHHAIGRVTSGGAVTEFHITDTVASTNGITTGADGNIWFTEGGDDVWRMHTNGALIGTSISVHSTPVGIAVGTDGNLWFAARLDGEIGRIDAAPGARSFILDIASGFAPKVRTVSLGRLVEWVMEAPGTHRVADQTGMGLFDSGPVSPVSFTTFRFPAAGRYPYLDRPGHRLGAVAVRIDGPTTGHTGTSLHLRWATAGAPVDAVFDVDIHRPGETGFEPFRTETTGHGVAFTPTHVGTYRFRARMLAAGVPGTGFSPVLSIHVG
jgi:plastocyanin